jgi:hypothetical protein
MSQPAHIYWPAGDVIQDSPAAELHPDGYAVVRLSPGVNAHVRTRAQADAIAAAFTAAGTLLGRGAPA